jgi:hypothetical protein
MHQSECIEKLASALIKVQANVDNVVKKSSNPFFKSKYADLATIWDSIRKPLSDAGLVVVQTMGPGLDGQQAITIVTTLIHTSGQWIEGFLIMPLIKTDPQAVGSAITYGRRYALTAMLGIAPEDDDGEAAMGRKNNPTKGNVVKIKENFAGGEGDRTKGGEVVECKLRNGEIVPRSKCASCDENCK